MAPRRHLRVALFLRLLRRFRSPFVVFVAEQPCALRLFLFVQAPCLCHWRSRFIAFILTVASLKIRDRTLNGGTRFRFWSQSHNCKNEFNQQQQKKVARRLVLFHHSEMICGCVRDCVFIDIFCRVKLSSWREVVLLLSCSYKPSGLGSHRDADALRALFARQSRLFCRHNQWFNHFAACLYWILDYTGLFSCPVSHISPSKRILPKPGMYCKLLLPFCFLNYLYSKWPNALFPRKPLAKIKDAAVDGEMIAVKRNR